jgi:cytochrome c oxidase assembly factor CtaG
VSYFGTTKAWGLTPLEDQQLAGLSMWIPAGLIYLAALLPLLAGALAAQERRGRSEGQKVGRSGTTSDTLTI